MSVLAVGDLIFNNLLVELDMNPWWEKWRGYCYAGSVATALFSLYLTLHGIPVHCMSVSTVGNITRMGNLTGAQASFVNTFCSALVPWYVRYSGVLLLGVAISILFVSSYWLHDPEVIDAVTTFHKMHTAVLELNMTRHEVESCFNNDSISDLPSCTERPLAEQLTSKSRSSKYREPKRDVHSEQLKSELHSSEYREIEIYSEPVQFSSDERKILSDLQDLQERHFGAFHDYHFTADHLISLVTSYLKDRRVFLKRWKRDFFALLKKWHNRYDVSVDIRHHLTLATEQYFEMEEMLKGFLRCVHHVTLRYRPELEKSLGDDLIWPSGDAVTFTEDQRKSLWHRLKEDRKRQLIVLESLENQWRHYEGFWNSVVDSCSKLWEAEKHYLSSVDSTNETKVLDIAMQLCINAPSPNMPKKYKRRNMHIFIIGILGVPLCLCIGISMLVHKPRFDCELNILNQQEFQSIESDSNYTCLYNETSTLTLINFVFCVSVLSQVVLIFVGNRLVEQSSKLESASLRRERNAKFFVSLWENARPCSSAIIRKFVHYIYSSDFQSKVKNAINSGDLLSNTRSRLKALHCEIATGVPMAEMEQSIDEKGVAKEQRSFARILTKLDYPLRAYEDSLISIARGDPPQWPTLLDLVSNANDMGTEDFKNVLKVVGQYVDFDSLDCKSRSILYYAFCRGSDDKHILAGLYITNNSECKKFPYVHDNGRVYEFRDFIEQNHQTLSARATRLLFEIGNNEKPVTSVTCWADKGNEYNEAGMRFMKWAGTPLRTAENLLKKNEEDKLCVLLDNYVWPFSPDAGYHGSIKNFGGFFYICIAPKSDITTSTRRVTSALHLLRESDRHSVIRERLFVVSDISGVPYNVVKGPLADLVKLYCRNRPDRAGNPTNAFVEGLSKCCYCLSDCQILLRDEYIRDNYDVFINVLGHASDIERTEVTDSILPGLDLSLNLLDSRSNSFLYYAFDKDASYKHVAVGQILVNHFREETPFVHYGFVSREAREFALERRGEHLVMTNDSIQTKQESAILRQYIDECRKIMSKPTYEMLWGGMPEEFDDLMRYPEVIKLLSKIRFNQWTEQAIKFAETLSMRISRILLMRFLLSFFCIDPACDKTKEAAAAVKPIFKFHSKIECLTAIRINHAKGHLLQEAKMMRFSSDLADWLLNLDQEIAEVFANGTISSTGNHMEYLLLEEVENCARGLATADYHGEDDVDVEDYISEVSETDSLLDSDG